MKKALFIMMALGCFSLFSTAYAATVTIINHFGQKLYVKVELGQEYTPDFPSSFLLPADSFATSQVVDGISNICETNPENGVSYIRIQEQDQVGAPPSRGYAFFGVNIGCPPKESHRVVYIDPYLSSDIAYSWRNPNDAVVVLCTPEAYKDNGNRCP